MAKKARKPKWQYQLIDSHGDPCVDFKRLKSALSNKRMQDDIYTETAPHRVYDANGEAECHQADVALEYAVEASRG